MKNPAKYLAVMVLATTLTSNTAIAKDEYLRDHDGSSGTTAAVLKGAGSVTGKVFKGAVDVVINVSKELYEFIKEEGMEHVVELGVEENSDNPNGQSRFVRYTLDIDGFGGFDDPNVDLR